MFRKSFLMPLFTMLTLSVSAEEVRLLPEDASTFGHHVDGLYVYLLYVTGAAFLAVVLSLFYFCIRYRHREGAKAHYTHGNSWTALGVTGTLAACVFLGIDMNVVRMSNAAAKEMQKQPDNALHIQVLAQQFSWSFRYSGPDGKFGKNDIKKGNPDNLFGLASDDPDNKDDIQVEGVLCVPVNTPIVLEMRAKDVIHSFFLPNFRVKQDVVPGMRNSMWFQATKTGDYDIACAELCGMLHSQMSAMLQVREQKEFEAWLKKKAEAQ